MDLRAARAPRSLYAAPRPPPQPRRSFRAAPRPGCACHYPQAVGDVLRVLGFLEQFQALFAQRLNPSMVALGQRCKAEFMRLMAILELSPISRNNAKLSSSNAVACPGSPCANIVIPRLPRETAVPVRFRSPGSTPRLR